MENFFSQMVAILAEAFRATISEVTVAAWEAALSDIPRTRLTEAARLAMRECKFMPSVAEIRELSYRGSYERESRRVLDRIDGYRIEAKKNPPTLLLPAMKKIAESTRLPAATASESKPVNRNHLTESEASARRQELLNQIENVK